MTPSGMEVCPGCYAENLDRVTAERDRFKTALFAIDRTLERLTGIFPQSVVQPDGTTHVRTEREEGENAATMRLTGAIWGILNPFWKDGTLPDIDDEIARLTAEVNEWRCADRDKAATIAALEIARDERDDALDLLRELSSFTVDMPDAWWARVDALLAQKERP